MDNVGKGIIAGFVATLVLSAIILGIDRVMTPESNPARLLTITAIGAKTPLLGWLIHFFIGSVAWGVIFAFAEDNVPGPYWFRGLIFGTGVWLLLTVFMMPLAGIVPMVPTIVGPATGTKAAAERYLMPFAMLLVHWIYGAVLGAVYGALAPRPGDTRVMHP